MPGGPTLDLEALIASMPHRRNQHRIRSSRLSRKNCTMHDEYMHTGKRKICD
jgi:hypothetical protein